MCACDTDLERDWLRVLMAGDFRLPDAAQPLLESARCRPDFLYTDAGLAVFIDGPVHDRSDKSVEDAAVEERLLDAGYSFVRFAHDEDWLVKLRERADVFGEGRRA